MSEEDAMFKFDFNIKETMELVGKQVVVTCIDGQEVTGKVVGFTSKYDNDSGVPTIDLASNVFNVFSSLHFKLTILS